jgi:hypothetical protein
MELVKIEKEPIYLLIDTRDDKINKRIQIKYDKYIDIHKSLYQYLEKIPNYIHKDKTSYNVSYSHFKCECNGLKSMYMYYYRIHYKSKSHQQFIKKRKKEHLKEIQNFKNNYKLKAYEPFSYL